MDRKGLTKAGEGLKKFEMDRRDGKFSQVWKKIFLTRVGQKKINIYAHLKDAKYVLGRYRKSLSFSVPNFYLFLYCSILSL